jgi:hypothetical protein
MPTRKQRRRRAKDMRHEWEYVVVDEEGQEVEVKPSELRTRPERASRNGAAAAGKGKAAAAGKPVERRGRPVRPVPPPTWKRAFRRAIPWVVVLVAILVWSGSRGSHHQSVFASLVLGVLYAIAFVPAMYFIDRAAYNRYLRASGRENEIEPLRRRR